MVKMSSSVYLSKSVIETLKCYGVSILIASIILFVVPLFLNYFLLYYVGGVLFLASIFAPFISRWLPKEKITPDGKAVFISGCDSGFGHMLAQRLDDMGFHVFAGCLFPHGDGALALRKSGSSRLHVIALDVTSDDSVSDAAAYVEENLKDNVLWAVVNNAGINIGGDLHWTSIDMIKRVLEVNTLGVVRVTKAFLSKLKQSKGRVITVASAAGRYTWPRMVPYCMSKSAAIGFCDGLRLEMYNWGIQVVTIEPWMYRTAMLSEDGTKQNIRQTWESAPKEVKELYDANYIDKYTKKCMQIIGGSATRNPGEVVSLMEDAVTNLYTDYSRSPGSIRARLLLWFFQSLPKPIADLIVYNVIHTD